PCAQVAELVDAPSSGGGAGNGVEVRVLSWAPQAIRGIAAHKAPDGQPHHAQVGKFSRLSSTPKRGSRRSGSRNGSLFKVKRPGSLIRAASSSSANARVPSRAWAWIWAY